MPRSMAVDEEIDGVGDRKTDGDEDVSDVVVRRVFQIERRPSLSSSVIACH